MLEGEVQLLNEDRVATAPVGTFAAWNVDTHPELVPDQAKPFLPR